MLEHQFSRRCCCICSFFEDVPSEIVIFESRQGALGAILNSHFFILKHFENDAETMLRTSHFFEDVSGETLIFHVLVCRAGHVGLPCCSPFSEDVCSESAVFKMRGSKAAFSTYHFCEDVSGETAIFHVSAKFASPTFGGCLRRNAYF